MRCKAIGRDFDRGCEFLQGTYNGAAFNMALLLQKRLHNFSPYLISFELGTNWNAQVAGTETKNKLSLQMKMRRHFFTNIRYIFPPVK